jgi:hypothetical protein
VISTVGDEGVALGAARRVIQALDSELSLPALNEAQ